MVLDICRFKYLINRFIMYLRNVHIHTDSWRSPLTVHDSQCGDNIDQGGCQAAVECPSPVGVLLFYPHLTHHFAWAGGQDVHLRRVHGYMLQCSNADVSSQVIVCFIVCSMYSTYREFKLRSGISANRLLTLFRTLS